MRKQKLKLKFAFARKFVRRGFTLTELLVVIAIISLLASIFLVALNNAKIKAREAKRKADVTQMEKALALYYNANNVYPIPGDGWNVGYNFDASGRTEWLILQAALSPYISRLPTDPSYGDQFVGAGYVYYASSIRSPTAQGRGFTLIVFPTETPQQDWSCPFASFETDYPNKFLCLYQ